MKSVPSVTDRGGSLRGEVAIVGMACMGPQALDLAALWENIVSGADALGDMPPVITQSAEPAQLLALKVAHEALRDAGYDPQAMDGIASFTANAAGASSLVALEIGVRDLLSGKCDAALVGGRFAVSDQATLATLTPVGALSRRSEIRPFDSAVDGTIIREGVGMLVCKRLEDAQQAGDRIYAVIKGIGTSSDGRALGSLAPRVEGEELALRRAYEIAGIDPATIGLIEAHGTGTPEGDAAEIEALTRVFRARDPGWVEDAPHCAIGTINSMIGRARPAAGAAGLIKAALALYHKILPPTLHGEQPNPRLGLERTPFYINTTATPWIHGGQAHPRRAGVSEFGCDGVNAHVVLEEYRDEAEDERPGLLRRWPTEVCLLDAEDRPGLLRKARELAGQVAASPPGMRLYDLASTLNPARADGRERLAIVAESLDDLGEQLAHACARLEDPECSQIEDVRGIYYFAQPLASSGKLAILFPGNGAQYVGMLRDLCIHFPVVRRVFDPVDGVGSMAYLFPPSWPNERERAKQRLWSSTSTAVQAVLAADYAIYTLFQRLHLRPDAVVGHSIGDFIASVAAGIMPDDEGTRDRLSRLWRAYDSPSQNGTGSGLLAVGAAAATALARLEELAVHLTVTMDNSPHQVVLAGPAEVIDRARARLRAAGIVAERLPFPQPYHTEAFRPCLGVLQEVLENMPLRPPTMPIYSCATADVYPADAREIRRLMLEHWCGPVRFQETIRKMYADGVRLFVELGPSGHLTTFVADILRGEPHLAVGVDRPRRHGLTQLNHVVGLLWAHGVPLHLDELYARRQPSRPRVESHIAEAPPVRAESPFAPVGEIGPLSGEARDR